MDGGGNKEVGEARGRQRILFFCAAVVLLFSPTDWLALERFSLSTTLVRLAWVGAIVLTGLAQLREDPRRTRFLIVALAVSSTAFYSALAQLTGGAQSPLFSWMLAVPLMMALVFQDFPGAIGGSGIAVVVAGLAILVNSGTTPMFAAEWAGEVVLMTWLALYVSVTHQRMRAREVALVEAGDEAAARARAYEAAVAARDQFLAVAAHELRTPLTSLLLQIEAIERGVVQKGAFPGQLPSERQRLDAVGRQARRMSALIDGMLDLSRLSGGWLELDLAETDLGALARDVAQRFAPDAAAASCAMTLRLDLPLLGLWDAARLDQIVTNLVGNALKYGAGRPVEIEADGDEAVVRLAVRDHGIGIPVVDQERIFQRFERATSERQYGGLGLGLWIASELTKALGGKISVASVLGQGATFTLELPRRAIIPVGRVRVTPARAAGGAAR